MKDRCIICRRKLTGKKSKARGIGDHCLKKCKEKGINPFNDKLLDVDSKPDRSHKKKRSYFSKGRFYIECTCGKRFSSPENNYRRAELRFQQHLTEFKFKTK